MKFIDKLKEEFKKRKRAIRARGKFSGTNLAEGCITSLVDEPLTIDTSIVDTKIRLQTLNSGAIGFTQGDYRIDNHSDKGLHDHSEGSENLLEIETVGGVLDRFSMSGAATFKVV